MEAISWPIVGQRARNPEESGKMDPRYRIASGWINWPVGGVGQAGRRFTSH